jgi:hypothetical protein
MNARHRRAQVNLHLAIQTRESDRTNAKVALEYGYTRGIVDAWLRGAVVNLSLAVSTCEAIEARAGVRGHVLRRHAYTPVGALDRRGLTGIGLHLAEDTREPLGANALEAIPARDALRSVATRRRGTVVNEELTPRTSVGRRTATLTLPAAAAVRARQASHCGRGVGGHGTLLVDGRVYEANVALGKGAPAVLAPQAAVVITHLMYVACVRGHASHRAIVTVVVGRTVYLDVAVLARVALSI